jgi:hypothetical protein
MTARRIFAPALVAAALTISGATSAQERDPRSFRHERAVKSSGASPERLPIDVALLSGGQPFTVLRRGPYLVAQGGLADLRFFDADGGEVQYLLIAPRAGDPPWFAGQVLPIAVTEKTSGFEADLGTTEPVDRISIEGLSTPFLKRMTLEASGDRQHWTMVVPEGTLFDLPAEGLRLTTLGFPSGPYRFFRVVWNDTNSGRVGLPRVVRARATAQGAPPSLPALHVAPFERRPSEPGRTRYHVRLPGSRLPIVALHVDAAGGHIARECYVTEQRVRGAEAAPVQLGRARLTRVVRDSLTASELRVPITSPAESEIDLVIQDGDNPPLEVTDVRFELAQLPWILVESKGVSIVARYGNRTMRAPSYDLEAARDTIDIDRVPAGSWEAPRDTGGAIIPAPAPDAPAMTGAAIDASAFRYARDLPSGGNAGLVALALDAALLAHSSGPARRFEDVRIVDASSRQVPYLVERLEEPLPLALAIEQAASRVPDLLPANTRRSVYRIRLPYPTLPDGTLVLTTSARLFRRTVTLGIERPPDRRHRDYYFETMGSRVWQGLSQDTVAPELSFGVNGFSGEELIALVDEGDNSALPIAPPRFLLPAYRLRFYQPANARLRLLYGRTDMTPPQYDLALLAPVVMGADVKQIAAAGETPSTAGPSAVELVSPRAFWAFLGAAILVILGVLVRLVRQSGSGST